MKERGIINKRICGLNSCIQIEEARISRRVSIPRQVYFQLTPQVISQIENLRDSKQEFKFDPETLTNLRYYALLNSDLPYQQNNVYHQSNLTFNSRLSKHSLPKATVIRSVINLNGQISQEIQQDLWQNPQLLSEVISIHYWLIEEILRQLPLPTRNNISLVIWVCWTPLAIAFTVFLWFFLPLSLSLSFLFKLTITIIGILLIKIGLSYIIRKKIKFWLLKQLSNGVLSRKNRQRQIGFELLKFLILN